MENALNSPSQVLGSQQQPPRRRNEVIKEIALALVTNSGVGIDSRQASGFDPYDNRLGSAQRDVWGKRRRA
jgi:hypothetical protein